MSNIVKAAAVVDDRIRQEGPVITGLFEAKTPVIKRQILSGALPYPAADYLPGLSEESYTEHINRIRLQMDEAKEELRKLTSRMEEAREEVTRLRREQEILESAQQIGVDVKVRQMLEDAEKQASYLRDRIKREAEADAEKLREQGYREGREQAQTEVRQAFTAEHQPDVDKISAMLGELSFALEEQVRKNESQIISLAVAISEKIIGGSLTEKPKRLVDMLRSVLEENRREAYIKVTISADLLPAEAKVSDEIQKMVQEMGQQIDVLVEEGMDPGSLVVETPKGFTDLSVHTQLENIEKSLQETLSDEE